MSADDQLLELEALESIYVRELTVFERAYPNIRFAVVVTPCTGDEEYGLAGTSGGDDGDEEEEDSDEDSEEEADGGGPARLRCVATFSLPADYPEHSLAHYTLAGVDDEDRVAEIRRRVDETAAENEGMPAVFAMVTTLQEQLTSLHGELAAAAQYESERTLREQEAADKKKIEGTPVTVENFLAWQRRCGGEIVALREQYVKARDVVAGGRLTGRQQFLQDATLALSDVAFAVGVGAPAESVEIDESLFDDDDLDDDPDYVPGDD